MISAILAFFSALPSLVHGFEAFTKAHYDARVKIKTAQIGGDVEMAKQLVTGIVAEGNTRVEFLKTVVQSKFLMWVVGIWSAPWMFYQAKVVAWDNILSMLFLGHYGYTPEIKGLVAGWAGVILAGIFGTGGVMAISQTISNWRKS